MKIVTWNCQGGLHNKFDSLAALNPDVAVVPEMAAPELIRGKLGGQIDYSLEWVGHTANKGLGVLINPAWEYRIAECFDPRFELFMPIEVMAPHRVNILAVWAFNHRAKKISPSDNATNNVLQFYSSWIASKPTIILGDFNNSVIWDKPSSLNNFREIIATLKELDQVSIYHKQRQQGWGTEKDSTLFMYRKPDAGYHVDYFFASENLLASCEKMSVGQPQDWLQISDHVPLSVEISL